MPRTPSIRLLLIDDHPVMRSGLANLLSVHEDFEVVGEADDGPSGLQMWRDLRPDVCLLDVSMQGMDGIETLRQIRLLEPEARVLMLTSSEAGEDVRYALEAGAVGYLTKNARHNELADALRQIHGGGRVVGSHARRYLAEGRSRDRLLSPRETEVLHLLRHGHTNAEIGSLMGISERTARAHVARIMEALEAPDRAGAVARGFDLGLLKASPDTPMADRRTGNYD